MFNYFFGGGPVFLFLIFYFLNSMKSWKIGIILRICSEPLRKNISGGKGFVLCMQNASRNKKNCIELLHLVKFFVYIKSNKQV